ncbi:MAG TPA: NifU family protein, partial [bacterium]|nr:NifU family protein [bacterium]
TVMSTSEETLTLSRAPAEAAAPAAAEVAPAGDASGTGEAELAAHRLTPAALLERRRGAEAAYVFDLRDQEAFDAGHLPGAYSLPFEHLEPNLHRLPFSGDLMLYDGGEGLVQQAARLLLDNGFGEFFFVEEGLAGLEAALRASPDEVHFEALNDAERVAKVEEILDQRVREFLARDGGGMEVKAIEKDRILVAYQGACGGCGSSTAGTLRFIQNTLTIALNHEMEVVPVEE